MRKKRAWPLLKIFICGVFKDTVNSSEYTVSNDKIDSELGKILKKAVAV